MTTPLGMPAKRRHTGWLTAFVIVGALMGIFGAIAVSNAPSEYNRCVAQNDANSLLGQPTTNCASYQDAHSGGLVLILLGVVLFLYGGIRLMQRGRTGTPVQAVMPMGIGAPSSVAPPQSATPPGWYQDATGLMRWWDGWQWTESTRPPSHPSGPQGF